MKTKAEILAEFLNMPNDDDVYLSSLTDQGESAEYEADGVIYKVTNDGEITKIEDLPHAYTKKEKHLTLQDSDRTEKDRTPYTNDELDNLICSDENSSLCYDEVKKWSFDKKMKWLINHNYEMYDRHHYKIDQ